MSILAKILDKKKREIADAVLRVPLEDLLSHAEAADRPRGFARSLQSHTTPRVIAEIKRASPSKGVIRADLDPLQTAAEFAAGGAACLSVLTDVDFFQGSLDFLPKIRRSVPSIPLLRKDFIIDRYQVWESRVHGADALLLIVAAIPEKERLLSLYREAQQAGLDVLVEVHDTKECEIALELAASVANGNPFLLGINNRDLKSFDVSLSTTETIMRLIDTISASNLVVVAESGIHSGADVRRLQAAGVNAFLIGESLVSSGSPKTNLEQLLIDSRA